MTVSFVVGVAWMAAVPGRLATPVVPDPIIGGTEVVAGEYEEVVALHVAGKICSATRIAPGLVLTAAHCLTPARDAGDIAVSTGLDAYAGPKHPAIAYGIHPEFCDCDRDAFDYGYVQLAPGALGTSAVATPIVDQEEWDAFIETGIEVTIVGYGEDPGQDEPARTKRKVTVDLGSGTPSGQEFAAAGEYRDSCRGDSGGPVFVELPDGTRRQIGITSRGSNPCGKGGYYANPYPALGWLRAETGVDLCGAQCGTCDCLDTVVPAASSGCGCQTTPESMAWWSWWIPVVLARRRRRR